MIEKIFSIKKTPDNKYKIITILGLKFKIKRKQFLIQKKQAEVLELLENQSMQMKTLLQGQKNLEDWVWAMRFHSKTLGLQIEELAKLESAHYIIEKMPKAKALNSSLEVLSEAISQMAFPGLILEFGVFSGRTINHISSELPDKIIYGFDSFEGLPEDWRSGFEKATFAVENLPVVNHNVELVKGWFDNTLPPFMDTHDLPCAFIHIDCDLYSSTVTVLSLLKERIQKGTVIVFDEYFGYPTWKEHEYKAFQEFIKETGLGYEYIAYNQMHEQCAIIIK